MDCRTAALLLSVEMDGELSPAESAALAAHVAGCASCAARRDALEETWRVVRRLDPLPVSPAFDEGVRARLARRHPARTWWALAAAAAVAVVLVGRGLRPTPREVDAPGLVPTPRIAMGVADPTVGLDCGLPGARKCRADATVVVLARPNVAFTAAH